MKAKLGWIALLVTALGWLGPAEPMQVEATNTALHPVQEEKAQAVISEAAPTYTPEPTSTPEPTATPEPTPEPTPTPEPDGPEICATTIAAGELKNYTSHAVDTKALFAQGCSLVLPAEGVQILIIHTHSCEAYTMEPGAEYDPSGDWRTLDAEQSVIAVGEALKEALEEYGLRVEHDTGLYDWPSYNGAYVNSGAAIEAHLAEQPEIAMVIDLHRDALGSDERIYKTVTDTPEPMAQLMFVVGSDENLPHPNWQENLSLALVLQQATLERCGTLMRPIDLSSCRYNQQLTTGSLLLEVGTCGNTLAEAVAAVECFAGAVGPVLAGMVEGQE